jgi:Holliday junction resolvase-like predicted endonuclease
MIATPEHRLFVHRIAEAWAEGSEAPSQPEGTLWRGSWAGMCARKVAYMTLGEERTDPPTTADYWRMGLGSVVHELLEPAIKKWLDKDDTVTVEEEISVSLGEHGNGHIDLVLNTAGGQKIVLELKTINGFGYKMAVEKVKARGIRMCCKVRCMLRRWMLTCWLLGTCRWRTSHLTVLNRLALMTSVGLLANGITRRLSTCRWLLRRLIGWKVSLLLLMRMGYQLSLAGLLIVIRTSRSLRR